MRHSYSPWAHIGLMPDVLVAFDDLEHADAYWEPDERVVLIDRRLGQAARRSKLAHEIAHIEAGDVCCHDGPDAARLNRRQERRADEVAARRLIGLEQLADALAWAWHTGEIADSLHVAEELVCVRIEVLSDTEKSFIEARLGGREGAA